MDPQMSNYAMGKGLMGFGSFEDADDAPPPPNRAQRRALAKRLKAQQRRGQRAHERALRNIDRLTPEQAATELARIKGKR